MIIQHNFVEVRSDKTTALRIMIGNSRSKNHLSHIIATGLLNINFDRFTNETKVLWFL
jgi:hypothetical protein